MKKILRICCIFYVLISQNITSFAISDQIVAIVNSTSITNYDIEQMKKMILAVYGSEQNNQISPKQLYTKALDTMINNILLMTNSSNFGIDATDDEVQNFIEMLETQNNFAPGYYKNLMAKNHVDPKYLENNIKSELLLKKILYSLSSSASVSKDEIDQFLLDRNVEFIKFDLKIFSSQDLTKQSHVKMTKLHKNLPNCQTIPKQSAFDGFATLSEIQDISLLSSALATTAKGLNENEKTPVLKTDDSFKIIMMCHKNAQKLSPNDMNMITRAIVNTKIVKHLKRFQDNLKHKAYIKIIKAS